MADPWIFSWYAPGNVPQSNYYWLSRGLAVPPAPIPFLLSDKANGLSVRFRSLLGAYSPPYVPVNQDVPFTPGSVHKFTNVEESEVDLKLLIQADSRELLWAKINKVAYILPVPGAPVNPLYPPQPSMAYLFNPLHGPGALQVTNPAGVTRILYCRCMSGFKIDPSTLEDKSVEVQLTFYANDPYWYDPVFQEVPVNIVQQNQNALIRPGLPALPLPIYRGVPDPAVGGVPEQVVLNTLTNAGDVNAYPLVTIIGPYFQPILTNLSIPPIPTQPPLSSVQNNVLSMTANGGLETSTNNSGGWANVDFKNKSLTQGSFMVNSVYTLTSASRFWPLLPGANNIQMGILFPGNRDAQIAAAAAMQSTVIYTWQNTYSTVM